MIPAIFRPLFAAAPLMLGACSGMPAGTAPVTYDNTIEALVQARCLACHGPDSPAIEAFDKDKEGFKAKGLGPRMDSYERLAAFVNGGDAGAIMRRLDDGQNTKDGKPGNMYQNLGDTGEARKAALAKFKAWVGSWNLKKKAELTDAERAAVQSPRR